MARYVVETRPAEPGRALASIEEASRAGLQEMRRLLATLRAPAQSEVVLDHPGGVADPGHRRRPAAGPLGQGIIGMRERAAVYGGTLSAGPTPTGAR